MSSESFKTLSKVGYFGAGVSSVLSNFANIECGHVGAALFVSGTIMLLISQYMYIDERYHQRITAANGVRQ